MKVLSGIAVVFAGLAATAAVADTPPASAAKEKLICRVESETGTRFKHRVCATAQEWAARDEVTKEARANVDKVQRMRALEGN